MKYSGEYSSNYNVNNESRNNGDSFYGKFLMQNENIKIKLHKRDIMRSEHKSRANNWENNGSIRTTANITPSLSFEQLKKIGKHSTVKTFV